MTVNMNDSTAMKEASAATHSIKGAQLDADNAAVDAGEVKQRLVKRAALAGGLIVALLAGLAIVDSMNAPPPAVQVAVVSPISSVHAPASEEKPAPLPAVEEEAKLPEEPPPAPEISAAPSISGKPEMPERLERPLTKPAFPHLAMLKPSEPIPMVKHSESERELVRQMVPASVGRQPKSASGAPASRPLSNFAAQPGSVPRVTEARNGIYLLQLGVFNSTANAEELRAKLELNGIPSQIEARVQVGPFKSRLEAEQTRDKLQALGISPGLVVAIKK